MIAPLDANTLSKLANGSCDNLLTSMARAWDFKSGKRIVVAPAMNTKMWEHPVTEPQVFFGAPTFVRKIRSNESLLPQ